MYVQESGVCDQQQDLNVKVMKALNLQAYTLCLYLLSVAQTLLFLRFCSLA